ncbi:hypothetical protein NUW54_g6226 [Trametes sanguinea]|uniref:Uncharacterized protein n=1 Tax=Trametes sanguinea TaxID=158606 RepID=A0ACC1PSV5_9APHY|nr:hypothetical protein NUW54_g6226 [Trametes sanguinea]
MDRGGPLGWTPGQPTAVIDLGEEFAPDPLNASSAALQFSAAYYAIDSSAEGNGSKKRKVERACDFCRRRKARCDGPSMPDNVCSNCIANSRSCTYVEGSKPRGPPKAYVVGLEDRVEKMEALLRRVSVQTHPSNRSVRQYPIQHVAPLTDPIAAPGTRPHNRAGPTHRPRLLED